MVLGWSWAHIHQGILLLQARYEILRSCLLELHRVGILDKESATPLPFGQLIPQVICRPLSSLKHLECLSTTVWPFIS